LSMKREVLVLGGLQVVITAGLAGTLVWGLGYSAAVAVVVGGAFAMSSTAIVAKQLSEQLELNLMHGRLSIGVLLFQDLAVIPLLIMIPAMSGNSHEPVSLDLIEALLKGVVALSGVILIGRWLLRPIFHEIALARSAELFTLAVLFFSLSAAWSTAALGLSLALGAFLAGMMLGETEFRHQVEADIRPFRDVLLGLFFVTVGMLLNVPVLLPLAGWILLALAGLILFKLLAVMLLARLIQPEWGVALRTGLSLAQGGEFGFALLALALNSGLIQESLSQFALGTIVLSMVVSPLLLRNNGPMANWLFPRTESEDRDILQHDISNHHLAHEQHVIICGYGRVGQNVARFLEQENIEYVALDLDAYRVRTARAAGDTVYYGDSAQLDVLRTAGLERARIIVISFFEVSTSLKILALVKKERPDIPVLVRTRDDSSLEKLQEAGATEVIPETLEASLMLVSHLLLLLNVPMSRIVRQITEVRNHRYNLLRTVFRGEDAMPIDPTHAFREQLYTITLPAGAYAVGRQIGEMGLEQAGIVVTALRREGIVGRQPDRETELREGDVLVLYGTPEDLEHAEATLLKG
ncbi:MAG: cation:proton antiporter, partial [Gammaproteobacteria bacterium]